MSIDSCSIWIDTHISGGVLIFISFTYSPSSQRTSHSYLYWFSMALGSFCAQARYMAWRYLVSFYENFNPNFFPVRNHCAFQGCENRKQESRINASNESCACLRHFYAVISSSRQTRSRNEVIEQVPGQATVDCISLACGERQPVAKKAQDGRSPLFDSEQSGV